MKITKSRLKEIINEEYRTVLSEQEMPTVGEFTDAFKKAEKEKWSAWTGLAAKTLVGLGVGALVSTGVGAGVGLAGVAGSASAELGQEAFEKIAGVFVNKSGDLAKAAIGRLNVPDDQRQSIDSYFDLDDDLEKLTQGKNSGLGKEFQKELYQDLETAFKIMGQDMESDPDNANKPVTDYISQTATQAMIKFLKDKTNVNVELPTT
jgi:hypothetical protein